MRRFISAIVLAITCSAAWSLCAGAQVTSSPPRAATDPAHATSEFGRLVGQLSEPGGYFDTDNLISNERGYLHVMGVLDRLPVRGGAYLGVGPDQNFSYIARIRPQIALLIDIRRDNMLQHLLFKALFARARNRVEYLSLWLGRETPADSAGLAALSVNQLVARIDASEATRASKSAALAAVRSEVQRFGVPLSSKDLETIERFHSAFIAEGLSLRFTSKGRTARDYYPSLRQLLLERDLRGVQANYLASEADFLFLKSMQRRDLIVPVVGDLAGPHALAAINALLRRRGDRVSAIYASNAEDYVMRDGGFGRYAKSVLALPRDERSVFIRSWFGGDDSHPQSVPGYFSTQLVQTIDDFATDYVATGFASYRDLTRRRVQMLR